MSYLAVVLVIAGVTSALVGSGIGSKVSASIAGAVCKVSGGDCASSPAGRPVQPASPAAGADGKGRGESPGPVTAGATNTPAPTSPSGLPTETVALLNLSEEGRKAVADALTLGMKVTLAPPHTYFYSDPASGRYNIPVDESPRQMALMFHEMVNGKRIWEQNLNLREASKKEYVETRLRLFWDREAESYTIDRSMPNAGPQYYEGMPEALAFHTAYDRAVRGENEARMRANRPPLTPAEAEAVGKKAGRDAMGTDEHNRGLVSRFERAWHICKDNRSTCRLYEAW